MVELQPMTEGLRARTASGVSSSPAQSQKVRETSEPMPQLKDN